MDSDTNKIVVVQDSSVVHIASVSLDILPSLVETKISRFDMGEGESHLLG
jgi:hypothetical protein